MKQHFAKGETLLSQGQPGDGMYMLRSGNVLVYRQDNESGKLIPIKQLGPGEIIGEMYLYNEGEVRSASIVAISDVVVDMLPDQTCRSEMEKLSPFHKLLIEGLAGRLNETTDNFVNHVLPPAPAASSDGDGEGKPSAPDRTFEAFD
jgi:CRP-like cAMP-binding protein